MSEDSQAPDRMADDPAPPDDDVVTAELVPPPAPRPRIWTAILVSIAGIIASAVLAGVVLAIAAYADQGPQAMRDIGRFQEWIRQFGQTRTGLLAMLIPPQLVFLVIALAAALISPRPLVQRLALTGGSLPLWTWAIFLIATPLVGVFASQMLSLLVDELSESLKLVESILRFHANRDLWAVMVLVALLPGVVEELMFRGYLQTRLAERWSPLLAILVSAAIFSAAHLDVVHSVGVLPLGLWLGAVAWRAGSIWPAIICHAGNNAVAVLGLKYQAEDAAAFEVGGTVLLIVLLLCLPAFLLSLYILGSRSHGQRTRS